MVKDAALAKKKYTRNKSGCTTCRKRKKRCDYGKPKCAACIRLNLDCEYQVEPIIWKVRNLNDDGTTTESVSMIQHTSETGGGGGDSDLKVVDVKGVKDEQPEGKEPFTPYHEYLSMTPPKFYSSKTVPYHQIPLFQISQENHHGHNENNRQEEDQHQGNDNQFNKSQKVDQSTKDSPEPEEVIPITREKSATPSSPWSISNFFANNDFYLSPSDPEIARLTKRDDDEKSTDLTLKDPEPFFKANITNEVYLTFDSNSFQNLHGYRFTLPKFVSVESAEILLSYFCEKMAPKFSVCSKEASSLVLTYLPLASFNGIVLSALLAWVSFHFEKNGDTQFVQLKKRLLQEVEVKLSEINNGKVKVPLEVTLASLLIMIAIENKGTSSNWFSYLRMAQKSIGNSKTYGDSSDLIWLKSNLLYHEVTGPALLSLEDSVESPSDLFDFDNLDENPEAYMGISRRIYKIMGDIFKLSRKLVTSSSMDVLEDVCEAAERLEVRIENCKPLEPTEGMLKNGTLVYHEIFFKLLKDTARLYIRQCVYMVAPVSIKSTMIVGRMMNQLKKLFGSEIDPALLFPLFIMGVDTVSIYVRDWVIKMMKDLYGRVGSGNILVAIKLLHKVWDSNNDGKIHVFWPQVAKDHGLLVSLA
ncbi:hypothetical protein CLIB1444_02S04720 [[Candida] jaroonii]|uniref:Uncharacterized protein n=1 Tax=[Candida] jaroonii TaxID=467808 RepID=A0ACA9Y2T6_9ASCO|nr:hypothetical protein CLIB1444_02S04720 [[Candida] jaroonii]